MVPVPASQRHKRETLPNPGGKWRWDNDEGWMAPGYEFLKADLLFFEKTRKFITEHRKKAPDKPFFAVFSTQIAHAPVLPAPEFNGTTKAGPRGDFVRELDTLVGRMIDLTTDPGETTNLFFKKSEKRQQLQTLLQSLKKNGRSAPTGRLPIGIENIPRLK